MTPLQKMPRSPKVSIIVPNLNKRKFLPECLESIRQQTFTDWEVIFVDGFSDDGSWEFAVQFWNGDSRIRLFQRERRGIYDAWNRGIKEARGEYIYIATSDDTMYPKCLERAVAILEIHQKIDLAAFPVDYIDKDSNVIPELYETHPGVRFFIDVNEKVHIRPGLVVTLLHFIFGTLFSSITGVFVRRCLFEKAGPFSQDVGTSGDREWMMRACLYTDVLWIPEKLATFRLYQGQASGSVCWGELRVHRELADVCIRKMLKKSFPHYESIKKKIDHLLEQPVYEVQRSRLLGQRGFSHKVVGAAKLAVRHPLWFLRDIAYRAGSRNWISEQRIARAKLLLHETGLPKVVMDKQEGVWPEEWLVKL